MTSAAIFWTDDKLRQLVSAAREGHHWNDVGAIFGCSGDAAKHAFQKIATEHDRRTRREHVTLRLRQKKGQQAWFVDRPVRPADDSGLSGNVFRDDPRAARKPLGRSPAATDPRYSLTPSTATWAVAI